jgi:hypothetical protein
MSVSSVPLFTIEGHSLDVGFICDAMFVAGARALGIDLNDEIPADAQEKILEAAGILAEGLREILRMADGRGHVRELGN